MNDITTIVKMQHIVYSNILNLFVYTTSVCNYKCNYCSFSQFKSSIKFLNLYKLYNFIIQLYNLKKQDIYIELIGGEPTLDLNIIKFSNLLFKYYPHIRLGIYTNFSQNIQLYQKLVKNNVNLTITWHSQHNNIFNQNFIRKLDMLPKECFLKNVEIHVMFEYNNINESIKIFKILRNKYVSTELRLLDHDFKTKKIYFLNNTYYSNQQINQYYNSIKKFKNYNKYLIKCIYNNKTEIIYSINDIYLDKKFYTFRFWKCNAGKDYLYINLNGDIYPCMKYYEQKINLIGNIKDISTIKFKNVICPFNRCPCVWETTKTKIFKSF